MSTFVTLSSEDTDERMLSKMLELEWPPLSRRNIFAMALYLKIFRTANSGSVPNVMLL